MEIDFFVGLIVGGFSFGAPPAAAATTTATIPSTLALASKPAASSPLSFGAKPLLPTPPIPSFGTTTATPAAAATTTTTISAPIPSQLRGKSLDEIVNTWSGELEERTKDFGELASEVREWDNVLRKNGDQVSVILSFDLSVGRLMDG